MRRQCEWFLMTVLPDRLGNLLLIGSEKIVTSTSGSTAQFANICLSTNLREFKAIRGFLRALRGQLRLL